MLTTLLEMSPMSFTSLLQLAPQREVLKVCGQMLPQLLEPETTSILQCYCGHLFGTWPDAGYDLLWERNINPLWTKCMLDYITFTLQERGKRHRTHLQ